MSVNLSEDPTILAMYAESEKKQDTTPRNYLGMSSIGQSCDRKLWNDFRQVKEKKFKATTLYNFADGHYSEDLTADRLRAVPSIDLTTHDENGNQYGFSDHNGHFKGHMDGQIIGLHQAPEKWHVWEHKACAHPKYTKFVRLTQSVEPKKVLEQWDLTYFGQAQMYMNYSGFDRHYLTVSSAGSRDYKTVRTPLAKRKAKNLIARAKDIITSDKPLDGISDKSDYFECRMCDYNTLCHGEAKPAVNCRTCIHSWPVMEGNRAQWQCGRFNERFKGNLVKDCNSHLYIPKLLSNFAEVEHANAIEQTVTYKSKITGETFVNGPYLHQYTSAEIESTDIKLIGHVLMNELKTTFGGMIKANTNG